MAKKLKINEQQLSVIVNYIKGDEVKPQLNESEVLEEGAKGWAMAGLMALASMAGMAQDKLKGSDSEDIGNYIEAAEEFKSKLSDESSAEYKMFKQETKDMNAENIEAIKNVNPNDKQVIKTFKTKNLGTAANKLKDGGMITDLVITTDTVWNDVPDPIEMDSTIVTDIDGNLFESGGFDLNQDVAEELSFQFQYITDTESSLTHIKISSSTDKEPVTTELAQKLVDNGYSGDNEGLAEARKNTIYDYLVNRLGIDSSLVELDVQWEQGPDAYSPDMSDADRIAAKALPGTTAARNVGVTWDFSKMLQGEDTEPVYKLIKKYMVEITKVESPLKGGTFKTSGGSSKTKKMKIPKLKMDNKPLDCELFGQKK